MSEKYRKTFPQSGFQILGYLLFFVILIGSCERLEIKRITKVSTGSVSYLTASSATVQGDIIEQGEGGIKKHGHCWSVSQNPTINNDKTELGAVNTSGTFSSDLATLSPDTKYYVRAYATDNEGTSYGNEISFITLNIPVPPAPTNLAADAESSTQITISWSDNSDNEEGFKIERSPNGTSDWTEIATVGAGITNFQNISLTPSTTYFYRVRAFNAAGNSGFSNTSNATTKINVPVPAAPTDLYAGAVSGSEIYLSWTDNSDNEAGFKIERAGASLAFREIAVVGADTSFFLNMDLTASVTYYYRVWAFNDGGNSEYSDTASATTCISPVAITLEPGGIDTNRATFNGIVNPNNYLTEVIFEWGLTPDLGNILTAIQSPVTGSDGINVSADITILSPNTRYYYSVSAAGCGAAVNGDTLSFVAGSELVYDANDNVYHVVRIGTQVWMKENLIATTPIDASGDVPLISDPTAWASLTDPGYCWYNNDARYKDLYGALYNWWAVGWRRLCPADWHVPSNDEWDLLIETLGGSTVAGGKMKVTGTDFWDTPNYGATNESGFTALPGGWRSWTDGTFMSIRGAGYWWSSTPSTETDAWGYHMYNWNGEINSNVLAKSNGFSIRCVRDF
jgi:uncharacterized protein (TIGR02145 family)